MKLFQKRESLTQNIAFMSLMSGITLVISVFATFFPILGVFIIIALPLTSTLVELYCKDRYYIIYAIGTIGLCLAANFWNIGTTFYYVIPSIFTGFIFGFMTKKSIPSVWTILVAATIQFGLTIGSIYIIRLMIGVDMLETFRTIFDFIDYDLFNIIFPTFCFLVSSIQVVLSYIVISNEIKKFGYEVDHDKTHMWIYQALTLVLCGSIIGFQFIYIPIAYVIVIMVY